MNFARMWLETWFIVLISGTLAYVFAKYVWCRWSSSLALRSAQWLFAISLFASAFVMCIPAHFFFQPAAHFWVASNAADLRQFSISAANVESFSGLQQHVVTLKNGGHWLFLTIFSLFLLHGIVVSARALLALKLLLKRSQVVKCVGRLRVLFNENVGQPLSFRSLWRCYVVLPTQLLEDERAYRLIVAHELQHHRQLDTSFVYLFHAVRLALPLNPGLWLWKDVLENLQEMACDNAVVQRNANCKLHYARSLLWVSEIAKTATFQTRMHLVARTAVPQKSFLRRRIETMYKQTRSPSLVTLILAAALPMTAIVGAAFASQSLVRDHSIDAAQVRAAAREATSPGGIPVVVNSMVVERVLRYLQTSKGRAHIVGSFERMQGYEQGIQSILAKYGLPDDLKIIPSAESGYRNIKWKPGAGLWGFIPSTGKRYNLVVDASNDDRLDVKKETVAAAKYLGDLRERFGDWYLAIKAYNEGENRVQSLIEKYHTHDAWELEAKDPGEHYLTDVMAHLMIYRNQKWLTD